MRRLIGISIIVILMAILLLPAIKVNAADPATVDCVLIANEDFLDNDMFSVEYWANINKVKPDIQINEQGERPSLTDSSNYIIIPTEIDNPWFYCNEYFPNQVVLMPTGRVIGPML